MRIATYNVEWFDSLFDGRGRMLADDGRSARYKVTRAEQLEALAIVFTAMDADAIMVIEAPDTNRRRSTVTMLEYFARSFELRTSRAIIGFANSTQQEIALLFDPEKLSVEHDPQGTPPSSAPRFDGNYKIDLDIDTVPEHVTFSKPPLELSALTATGRAFRMIGVHVKSKAPHGAKGVEHQRRLGIENRRKQLAQCIWLRERVLEHIGRKESLIVMGDFNDGPGLDEFEHLFGRSGVEVVLGWDEPRETRLFDPHARIAISKKLGLQPTTARFYLPDQDRYFQALLDYIMISPDLRQTKPKWRIWHPFDDAACFRTPELSQALLTASDHYPVTIDIDL